MRSKSRLGAHALDLELGHEHGHLTRGVRDERDRPLGREEAEAREVLDVVLVEEHVAGQPAGRGPARAGARAAPAARGGNALCAAFARLAAHAANASGEVRASAHSHRGRGARPRGCRAARFPPLRASLPRRRSRRRGRRSRGPTARSARRAGSSSRLVELRMSVSNTPRTRLRLEPDRRLVHEQHLRIEHQRSADLDRLLLAARERSGPARPGERAPREPMRELLGALHEPHAARKR